MSKAEKLRERAQNIQKKLEEAHEEIVELLGAVEEDETFETMISLLDISIRSLEHFITLAHVT